MSLKSDYFFLTGFPEGFPVICISGKELVMIRPAKNLKLKDNFRVEIQFSSVQSLSRVRRCATLWTTAHQASLSITNSRSLLKLNSIRLVILSSHLILCRPLLLLPSILPSTRVFSIESVLHIRWANYWSFSFNSVLPMNIQD